MKDAASPGGEVVIACAADARFVRPLTVMLRSTVAHLARDRTPVVFVVSDGIGDADRTRVASAVGTEVALHWLEPDLGRLRGVPLWGRMSATTYTKLLLPELLPNTVERLIWLDSDLIVRRDLGALWDVPQEGYHVRAVQDALVPLVSSSFGVARYGELGLPREAPYFNAGVMIVDLAAWRRDGTGALALGHVRRNADRVFFWDQEGLNAVLAGRVGLVDPRWNRNAACLTGPGDAWILHFAGALKPWAFPRTHPYRVEYDHYLDERFDGRGERASSRALALYAASRARIPLAKAERARMRLTRRFTRRGFDPDA
jgi:lipopolysaccharide biosynthesis glycosyltransferase